MVTTKQEPRLIFRVQRQDKSGIITTEERELAGCSGDELMKYLCAPWETIPEAGEISPSHFVDELAEAIDRRLRDLQLVITEHRPDLNTRAYTLGFRQVGEAGETGRVTTEDVKQSDTATHLRGGLQFQVRGDTNRPDVTCGDGHSRIEVNNRALLLSNKNNVYAIVNIYLDLNIRGAESSPAADL